MGESIGLIFWLLIIFAAPSFTQGLLKKSWYPYCISGITLFLTTLYFLGAENWLRLLVLLPAIPFYLAVSTKKKNISKENPY